MDKRYIRKGITIRKQQSIRSILASPAAKKKKIEVIDLVSSSSAPSGPSTHNPDLQRILKKTMTEDFKTPSPTSPLLQIEKRECVLYPLGFISKRRYGLIEKIGGGAYGELQKAKDIGRNELVAIKVSKEPRTRNSFAREIEVYKKMRGVEGFAKLKSWGMEDRKVFMVLELLGPSLHSLTPLDGMPIGVVANVAVQLITRLEALHKSSYVHRDVKPGNFCVGRNKHGAVYILDFGLTVKLPKETRSGVLQRETVKGLIGTKLFAPLAAHDRLSQGMGDDMIGLGFSLAFMALGNLPWISTGDKQELSEKDIASAKVRFLKEPNYNGRSLPIQFVQYFSKVASMKYGEIPDYEELRDIFKSIPNSMQAVDWTEVAPWCGL